MTKLTFGFLFATICLPVATAKTICDRLLGEIAFESPNRIYIKSVDSKRPSYLGDHVLRIKQRLTANDDRTETVETEVNIMPMAGYINNALHLLAEKHPRSKVIQIEGTRIGKSGLLIPEMGSPINVHTEQLPNGKITVRTRGGSESKPLIHFQTREAKDIDSSEPKLLTRSREFQDYHHHTYTTVLPDALYSIMQREGYLFGEHFQPIKRLVLISQTADEGPRFAQASVTGVGRSSEVHAVHTPFIDAGFQAGFYLAYPKIPEGKIAIPTFVGKTTFYPKTEYKADEDIQIVVELANIDSQTIELNIVWQTLDGQPILAMDKAILSIKDPSEIRVE